MITILILIGSVIPALSIDRHNIVLGDDTTFYYGKKILVEGKVLTTLSYAMSWDQSPDGHRDGSLLTHYKRVQDNYYSAGEKDMYKYFDDKSFYPTNGCFFKNTNDEYVIVGYLAKTDWGIAQYPKMLKYNNDFELIYEYTDTLSDYRFTNDAFPSLEFDENENIYQAVLRKDIKDTLNYINLAKFDKNAHFINETTVFSAIGDTILGNNSYDGIVYEPTKIKYHNGFFYITGNKKLFQNQLKYIHPFIIKCDKQGNMIWYKEMFEDFSNQRSYYYNGVEFDDNDNPIIYGYRDISNAERVNGETSAFLRIIDKDSGDEINKIDFGNRVQLSINSLIRTKDNGYIGVGGYKPNPEDYSSENESNQCIFKFDSNFNIEWEHYAYPQDMKLSTEYYSEVKELPEDAWYVAIGAKDHKFYASIFQVESSGVIMKNDNPLSYNITNTNAEIKVVFETDDLTNIKMQLFDIAGNRVCGKEFGFVNGASEFVLDVPNVFSGVYFLTIETNHGVFTHKIIFIK